MAGVNYYPFHIGDYVRETAHLSMLEDAAYRRLLDLYYTTEKPFEQPVDELCVLVRAKSPSERAAVQRVIATFFYPDSAGVLHHKRCDREIAKAKDKSSKAAGSAAMRWQSPGNANALRTQSEGNASQEPITNTNKNQWWRSQQGIEAKGVELGMKPWPGESWADYKRRIFDKINTAPRAAA